MSNSQKRQPMKGFPEQFSPLHLYVDILEEDKILPLYKFYTAFIPNLGPGILNLLLDMEKHSHKVLAAIEPEERDKLIKELEGVTIEMRYVVKDKGKETMVLPINISPAEVLRNAALDKKGSRYSKKMQEEMNNILISFIRKEIQRKIKAMTEGFLKNLLAKPKFPSPVKELLNRRLIDEEGHLAEGTTIEDLISGKYAKLFKKVVPEELVNEALLIEETIKTYYDWEDEDYQTLANEALAEKGILEVTLGEVRKESTESEE